MDSTTILPARAGRTASRRTVVALVGDDGISQRLREVCERSNDTRYVRCEWISDLVMSVFGIRPDIAVLDIGLIEDFHDALLHQLRQGSPSIEVVAYGPEALLQRHPLNRRGVRISTPSQVAGCVAHCLQAPAGSRPAPHSETDGD